MSRYGYGTSEEHEPVTWWRGHPVYAVHLLVAVLVGSMLVTTGLMFARAAGVLDWLGFSSTAVWQGQLWRVATYGLVNPPSLGFAIDMLMIIWFGREVERFLGRRVFLQLYAGVYLLTPLLFTALGPVLPARFAGETGAFAIFIAFATLFPNLPLLFNILAKWAALVLVGISVLMALAAHDWIGMVELGLTCGFAHGFVRYQQGHFRLPLPRIRIRRREPQARVSPEVRTRAKAAPVATPAALPAKGNPMAEVDALLDKIAQQGIHSLSAEERARLESARSDLMKRGGRR